MDNQLLRYGAKDYFFRAVICRMCQDIEDAEVSMQKYKEMFPTFADAREYKFCQVKQMYNFALLTVLCCVVKMLNKYT